MSDTSGLSDRCLAVSLLYANPTQRERFLAAAALRDEIVAVAALSPQVRPIKCQWWRDELERWSQGAARHPLTLHCVATGLSDTDSVSLAHEWITLLDRGTSESIEVVVDWRIDAFRRYGALLLIALFEGTQRHERVTARFISNCANLLALIDEAPNEIDANTRREFDTTTTDMLKRYDTPLHRALGVTIQRMSDSILNTGQPRAQWRLSIDAWWQARKSTQRRMT
ncbi:MAG: hypothetical protein AAGA84_12035 [Pseudomonadota bacterium]